MDDMDIISSNEYLVRYMQIGWIFFLEIYVKFRAKEI